MSQPAVARIHTMPLPSVASLLSAQPTAATPIVFLGGVLTGLTPCSDPTRSTHVTENDLT